jgi:hypothetical protein
MDWVIYKLSLNDNSHQGPFQTEQKLNLFDPFIVKKFLDLIRGYPTCLAHPEIMNFLIKIGIRQEIHEAIQFNRFMRVIAWESHLLYLVWFPPSIRQWWIDQHLETDFVFNEQHPDLYPIFKHNVALIKQNTYEEDNKIDIKKADFHVMQDPSLLYQMSQHLDEFESNFILTICNELYVPQMDLFMSWISQHANEATIQGINGMSILRHAFSTRDTRLLHNVNYFLPIQIAIGMRNCWWDNLEQPCDTCLTTVFVPLMILNVYVLQSPGSMMNHMMNHACVYFILLLRIVFDTQ